MRRSETSRSDEERLRAALFGDKWREFIDELKATDLYHRLRSVQDETRAAPAIESLEIDSAPARRPCLACMQRPIVCPWDGLCNTCLDRAREADRLHWKQGRDR